MRLALAAMLGLLLPGMAAAQSPDITDLVGVGAARAQHAMTVRGYYPIRMQGSVTFWWHEQTRMCVAVQQQNSTFVAVANASPRDCGG